MAVFSDLPVELIVKILWETQPLDLISFAAVSKQIHLLAGPLLKEDKQLRKEYAGFSLYHNSDYMFLDNQLAKLLIAIIQNPRVALNITKLAISNCRFLWDESSSENHSSYASDVFEQFERMIRRTKMVPVDEVDQWISAVRTKDNDPLLALLLLNLPNLQILTLACIDATFRGKVLKTIERISQAEEQSYLLQLKEVQVHYSDYSDLRKRRLPYALMSLPSVCSFGAEYLHNPNRYPGMDSLCPYAQLQDIYVKDFTFKERQLRTEHICEIVKKTRCLRSLVWQAYETANTSHTFISSDLMTSLVANASLTLEHLTLRTDGRIAKSLGSLQELRSLREIDVDIAMMFDVEGNDILTWPSRLPSTLEKLSLNLMDDHIVQIYENFCEAFRCLLQVRKERTPNLIYICIRMKSEDHCRKAYDHIQHPFSAAGIYLRHDHPTGGGHMNPGCGDCSDCNPVVKKFLCETGGPEAHSSMGCCTS